jgi:PII-like signaling protein
MGHRTARRITVIVNESDVHDHAPLVLEIVARAHAAGLPGASVFRGIGGFGLAHSTGMPTSTTTSGDRPIMIVMIADPESADDAVQQIAPLLRGGLLVVDDVVEIGHDLGISHDRRPLAAVPGCEADGPALIGEDEP